MLVGLLVGYLVASLLSSPAAHTAAPVADAGARPAAIPTFTPTPVAANDYVLQAAAAQEALGVAMARAGALIATPQLGESTWLAEVEAAMQAVEAAYADLLRLQPPAAWQTFHARLTDGAADCNAAMHVLDLALQEQSPSMVTVVAALMDRCETTLTAAQELATELGAGEVQP